MLEKRGKYVKQTIQTAIRLLVPKDLVQTPKAYQTLRHPAFKKLSSESSELSWEGANKLIPQRQAGILQQIRLKLEYCRLDTNGQMDIK